MLHSITTPRPWTAGAQVIEDVFEDARQLKRVVKRQHWKDHWQVNTPEPLIENTPWKNKDLQDAEEAFLHTKAEELKRAASRYMASTGVGADGFHPKVPVDLSTETCGYIVVVLAKVEQCGYWPVQASTHLFFLIPKNVTSERPNCFAAFSQDGALPVPFPLHCVPELAALVSLMRRLANHGARQQRILCYVDSRVVFGAVTKGRSSSRKLNSCLRKLLASSLTVDLLWVLSWANFADPPAGSGACRRVLERVGGGRRRFQGSGQGCLGFRVGWVCFVVQGTEIDILEGQQGRREGGRGQKKARGTKQAKMSLG